MTEGEKLKKRQKALDELIEKHRADITAREKVYERGIDAETTAIYAITSIAILTIAAFLIYWLTNY